VHDQALLVIGIIIATTLFIGIYFLPWHVARYRRHLNAPAIFVVNLFFGWSLIGWVACMVWAVLNRNETPPHRAAP
jgi:ABC-type multidrug transport system permease subunit